MLPLNIVCISIDGLRASALGAYGNTWHPTPALDALASQSQVFDWMFCDSPSLEGFLDGAWQQGEDGLARQAAAAAVVTALTTDDRAVAVRAEASSFGEIRQVEFPTTLAAATIADTRLAQLFAVAIDQIIGWSEHDGAAAPARRLLWLHARGYRGAWDAPRSLRESLLDDEDPPAPTFVAPPAMETISDHDELLLYRVAYAAQTIVLDECTGALMAALAECGLADSTLIILVGARGFPLGEHGVVGGESRALYGELLHVPLLIRAPGAIGQPSRSPRLVQPANVYATISEALGGSPAAVPTHGNSLLHCDNPAPIGREFIVASGDDGERAIRTPAWMLRDPGASAQPEDAGGNYAPELYFKPDDRWEANEIASRAPDVAARLLAVLEAAAPAGDGESAGIAPLSEDLISHV